MEQEWISLNEFMRRNHVGYDTVLKLMSSGKLEYEKIGKHYKIKTSKNEEVNKTVANLIRRNEELEMTIKTIVGLAKQAKIEI